MTDRANHWIHTLIISAVISAGIGVAGWQIGAAIKGLAVPARGAIESGGAKIQGAVVAQIQNGLAPIGELSKEGATAMRQLTADLRTLDADLKSADVVLKTLQGKVDTVDLPAAVAGLTAPLARTAGTLQGASEHVNALLDRLRLIPDQVAPQAQVLSAAAAGTLSSIKASADQVDAALPDLLDCYRDGYGNPDCLAKRWAEISRSSTRIADAIDKWVERLTAPASVKAQIRDWLKFIVGAGSRVL